MDDIAIIGGGPGGLLAAYFLEKKLGRRCRATLFEASHRLGGKVVSRRFDTAAVPYEAGVAELYDYSAIGPDPLRQLVASLGLETVPMDGAAVILGERILRTDADIRRQCGPATLAALNTFYAECAEVIAPADYYEGHWQDDNEHPLGKQTFRDYLERVPDATARRYIETAVHSDIATESHLTNALNGIKNALMDDPRYLRLYSIVGGIEQLPLALAERLTSEVLFDHAVTRIESDAGRYRVVTRHGTRTFDVVILAVPDYWLRTIEFAEPRLARAVHRHCARYDNPAHYLRVSVLFEEPFWRDTIAGSYWMHDAFGGCCVYDEGARHDTAEYGVLGWLLAGHEALVRSNLDDATLTQQVLDSLPGPLARGRELVREAKVQRWVAAINGQPGGYPLREPLGKHRPDAKGHPNLYLVGDYLFDSTINGVMDSADMVTDMLLSDSRRRVHNAVASANGHHNGTVLDADYFALYDGARSYEESFAEYFDAEYTTDLIRAVWGYSPPYKLLDVGSASGLTLAEFADLGVDAWGVENNPTIHARTPAKWRKRNRLGDIRALPFKDGSFDFVYETCLCYVPEDQVEAAIRELCRVVKVGVIFGDVTTDMSPEIIESDDIFYGAQTLRTLWEWSELFLKNGFRPAIASQKVLTRAWKIETAANEGGPAWYPNRESFRYCFYTKATGR